MSKAERDRELDAIAQYLPTNPPKEEIEKLRKAQALLLDASEHHDRKQDEQVRQAELTKALTPAGQDTPKGATAEQIDEAFAMLESVVPDPNRPGVSVVVTHGLTIPVAEEDVRAEKAWLTAKYGELADIYSEQMMQVHSGWAAQVDANEAHPLIHGLAWLQSDAEDPGNVDAAAERCNRAAHAGPRKFEQGPLPGSRPRPWDTRAPCAPLGREGSNVRA